MVPPRPETGWTVRGHVDWHVHMHAHRARGRGARVEMGRERGCGRGLLSQGGQALVSTAGDLRAPNTNLAFCVARGIFVKVKGHHRGCITVF